MKRALVIAGSMFCIVLVAGNAQTVGSLTYFEGEIGIVREGVIRTGADATYGEPLYLSDVIQTGPDSFAEIALSGDGVAPSTLRVDENSAYYLELIDGTSTSDTRVRLLNGSVRVAVERLQRGQQLSVETSTAVLGVRGTEFDVLMSPDEATLLGVREGTVNLSASGGNVRADAGSAVEALASGPPSVETVPNGDFDRYFANWEATRIEIFRSGAPVFVAAYARRYDDLLPTFEAAFDDLVAFRRQLTDAVKNPGSAGDDIQLKMAIGPALTRMRSIQPLFENTVYRLRDLRRFHDQGIGKTSIDGVDSDTFFQRFAREESLALVKISMVRHIFALYRQIDSRGFGGMPGGGLPDGLQSPFGNGGVPPSTMDTPSF